MAKFQLKIDKILQNYLNTYFDMYTMQDWARDGSLKVKQGNIISSDVYERLLNCIYPATYTSQLFQMGETYDYDEQGNVLYVTFKNTEKGWMFCGHCRIGETTHREGLSDRLMKEYGNNSTIKI